jgi:hypothetical protein
LDAKKRIEPRRNGSADLHKQKKNQECLRGSGLTFDKKGSGRKGMVFVPRSKKIQ